MILCSASQQSLLQQLIFLRFIFREIHPLIFNPYHPICGRVRLLSCLCSFPNTPYIQYPLHYLRKFRKLLDPYCDMKTFDINILRTRRYIPPQPFSITPPQVSLAPFQSAPQSSSPPLPPSCQSPA